MIAITLRRSERKQLGAEIGTDLTWLSLLPKEDPNDLKSIKIGFPKCIIRKYLRMKFCVENLIIKTFDWTIRLNMGEVYYRQCYIKLEWCVNGFSHCPEKQNVSSV